MVTVLDPRIRRDVHRPGLRHGRLPVSAHDYMKRQDGAQDRRGAAPAAARQTFSGSGIVVDEVVRLCAMNLTCTASATARPDPQATDVLAADPGERATDVIPDQPAPARSSELARRDRRGSDEVDTEREDYEREDSSSPPAASVQLHAAHHDGDEQRRPSWRGAPPTTCCSSRQRRRKVSGGVCWSSLTSNPLRLPTGIFISQANVLPRSMLRADGKPNTQGAVDLRPPHQPALHPDLR